MPTFPKQDLIYLAIITILLGLLGGTPFWHSNFVVDEALGAIKSGGHPQRFIYPALVIYLNSFCYGTIYGVMYLFGLVNSPEEFRQFYHNGVFESLPGPISFYLPGHLITIAFSVLGVICTYLITYQILRDRIFAFISALFLSTSLLWIANTHFITVDIALSSLALATILMTLVYTESGTFLNRSQLIILGVLIGLTISAKYNGVAIAIAVVMAIYFYYQNHKQWLIHSVILGSIALVVFIVINPFIFIDIHAFIEYIQLLQEVVPQGTFGYTTEQGWLSHLQNSLYFALGWPILGLSLLGLYWFNTHKTVSLATKLTLLLFPLIFYFGMGSSKISFYRYILPVVPFVTIYASLGLYWIYDLLRQQQYLINKPNRIKLLLLVLAVVVLFPNLNNVLYHNLLLSKTDTRAYLETIIEESQFASGKTVFAGPYTRKLFSNVDAKLIAKWGKINPNTLPPLDILIFDSFSHDRFIYEPYPEGQFAQKTFGDGSLIQISPFTQPKTDIPFSPNSIYSPYLPDLHFRDQAGPFIELYNIDSTAAESILGVCKKINLTCTQLPKTAGYYYQNLT